MSLVLLLKSQKYLEPSPHANWACVLLMRHTSLALESIFFVLQWVEIVLAFFLYFGLILDNQSNWIVFCSCVITILNLNLTIVTKLSCAFLVLVYSFTHFSCWCRTHSWTWEQQRYLLLCGRLLSATVGLMFTQFHAQPPGLWSQQRAGGSKIWLLFFCVPELLAEKCVLYMWCLFIIALIAVDNSKYSKIL